MGQADPLRLTGGPGGVDHIGQLLCGDLDPGRIRGQLPLDVLLLGVIEDDRLEVVRVGQLVDEFRTRHDQASPGIPQHVGRTFLGLAGCDGHITSASREDAEHGHQEVRAVIHEQADPLVRTHAQLEQSVGQSMGRLGELSVGELPVAGNDRGGRGGPLGLCLEQLEDQGRVGGGAAGGWIHAPGQPLDLLLRNQRDFRQPQVGIFQDRGDRPLELGHQALHGRGVVEPTIEFQGGEQASCVGVEMLLEVQAELEFRFSAKADARLPAVPAPGSVLRPQGLRQWADLQAFDMHGFAGVVLDREPHLEQRGVLQAPLRAHRFHHPLEGHVLVGLGPQGCLLDPRQGFAEGRISVELRAQHQGIDEEADHVLGLQVMTPRHRCAEAQVLEAGPAHE